MLIAIIVLVTDLFTKAYINSHMAEGDSFTAIPKLLDITYVHNTGAAWGIFSNKSTVLVAFILIMIVAMVIYIIKAKPRKSEKIALYLIISGGIGNLLSRAIYGFVVDFLNIHIIPVFNVADMAICAGCGLLLLYVFFFDKDIKDSTDKTV